jgi:hypothetical protein
MLPRQSWIKFLPWVRQRRVLWLLNHKTLLPAEVPILESFGFEVFAPASTPLDPDYASATARHDKPLTISPKSRAALRDHGFYTEAWSKDLRKLINNAFDLVVTSVINLPLIQTLQHFKGPIIARVFGREAELNYTQLFEAYGCTDLIKSVSDRFMFGQAYSNIGAIEESFLQQRARTIGCAVPESIWEKRNSWNRSQDNLLFICPRIDQNAYYREKYEVIKTVFASTGYTILGAQTAPSSDPNVLGYVSDAELFRRYAASAAFLYMSPEERHLHYSPIEAIVVGMPVLYMKGSMLATLAGMELPGECRSLEEMREKASRLVRGDKNLQEGIIATQARILTPFTDEVVKAQWKAALAGFNLI